MKILINHFIDYKDYNSVEYRYHYDENDISMFEFIKMRNEIYDEIPTLMEPDFAQDSRLSTKARNRQDDYMKDN